MEMSHFENQSLWEWQWVGFGMEIIHSENQSFWEWQWVVVIMSRYDIVWKSVMRISHFENKTFWEWVGLRMEMNPFENQSLWEWQWVGLRLEMSHFGNGSESLGE